MDDARRDGAADLLLLSEEELLLERADALLARGGVERSEHAPEPERYRYVRRASSVDSRRSLVRRFLTHKWSIKTRGGCHQDQRAAHRHHSRSPTTTLRGGRITTSSPAEAGKSMNGRADFKSTRGVLSASSQSEAVSVRRTQPEGSAAHFAFRD